MMAMCVSNVIKKTERNQNKIIDEYGGYAFGIEQKV